MKVVSRDQCPEEVSQMEPDEAGALPIQHSIEILCDAGFF